MQSLYFLNLKFQDCSHLLWLYTSAVSDMVGNPEDRFSHDAARLLFRLKVITYKDRRSSAFWIQHVKLKYISACTCLLFIYDGLKSVAI